MEGVEIVASFVGLAVAVLEGFGLVVVSTAGFGLVVGSTVVLLVVLEPLGLVAGPAVESGAGFGIAVGFG